MTSANEEGLRVPRHAPAPPPELLDDGAIIKIQLAGRAYRFHAIWLRDNAQDAATRDPTNRQRLITLLDIPHNIRIRAASWTGHGLDIEFARGNKSVEFDLDWLLAHAYDKPAPAAAGWTDPVLTRWDAALAEHIPSDSYAAVREDEAARRNWLAMVRRYGFACLSGCPRREGIACEVTALFGYVRETNYGRSFGVRTRASPSNLADTDLGLQAHTDNPYRDPTPGLQILACLENSVDGGSSVIVDGFKVAERLQAHTPQDITLLSGYCARFEYSGSPRVVLRSKRPILELSPDGELVAVRFNNRSAAAFTDIPFDVMAEYYRAYRRMAELVEDPALSVRLRLQPGDLLLMDNLRILHGREAFGSVGDRWLEGCYADLDSLRSTLAVMEQAEVTG